MTDRKLAVNGYNRTTALSEGYVRKGGVNPPQSQIKVRPPAPAAMRPATPVKDAAAPSSRRP